MKDNERDLVVAGDGAIATPADPREAFLAGRLTEKTRTAYRQDLEAFFAFAGVTAPGEITADRVTAWRNAMMDAGRRPATIARKLTAVRALCDYLIYHGHLEKNPADPTVVRAPRVSGVSRTQGLTAGQAERLLEVPDRATLRGARDYALLKWMLHLGLRREELARLTIADLGEARGYRTARIAGKGGKDRVLPLQDSVWDAMIRYLEQSGRDLSKEVPAAPLFQPTKRTRNPEVGKRLHAQTIWQVVLRAVRQAGIRKRITPHSLRHTAITLALDGGATIRQAQTFAGHADPKTTVRYDRTREDLDKSAAHLIRLEDR